jgi:hypothetical protein
MTTSTTTSTGGRSRGRPRLDPEARSRAAAGMQHLIACLCLWSSTQKVAPGAEKRRAQNHDSTQSPVALTRDARPEGHAR